MKAVGFIANTGKTKFYAVRHAGRKYHKGKSLLAYPYDTVEVRLLHLGELVWVEIRRSDLVMFAKKEKKVKS